MNAPVSHIKLSLLDGRVVPLCDERDPKVRDARSVVFAVDPTSATCTDCLCGHLRRIAQELVRGTLGASAHRASLKASIRRIFELSVGANEEIRFVPSLGIRIDVRARRAFDAELIDAQRAAQLVEALSAFLEKMEQRIRGAINAVLETFSLSRDFDLTAVANAPSTCELVIAIPSAAGVANVDALPLLNAVNSAVASAASGLFSKITIELREPRP